MGISLLGELVPELVGTDYIDWLWGFSLSWSWTWVRNGFGSVFCDWAGTKREIILNGGKQHRLEIMIRWALAPMIWEKTIRDIDMGDWVKHLFDPNVSKICFSLSSMVLQSNPLLKQSYNVRQIFLFQHLQVFVSQSKWIVSVIPWILQTNLHVTKFAVSHCNFLMLFFNSPVTKPSWCNETVVRAPNFKYHRRFIVSEGSYEMDHLSRGHSSH